MTEIPIDNLTPQTAELSQQAAMAPAEIAAMGGVAVSHQLGEIKIDTEQYGRGAELATALNKAGITFLYTNFDDQAVGETFVGLFVLNHQADTQATEQTVRLYRGVSSVDRVILDQEPYALRDAGGNKAANNAGNNSDLSLAVERYVHAPSYSNLRLYADTMMRQSSAQESQKIADRLHTIENFILEGDTIGEAMRIMHITSMVGRGLKDISPYVAASAEPDVADRFGDGALLVLDVPLSRIAGNGESGEVLMAGSLPVEYITAVAIKKDRGTGFTGVADKVAAMIPRGVTSDIIDIKQVTDIVKEHGHNLQHLDPELQLADQIAVSKSRTEQLLATIPESVQASITIPQPGADSYNSLQRNLFNYYCQQLPEIEGSTYNNPEDSDYHHDTAENSITWLPSVFSIEKVTDGMIAELHSEYQIHLKTLARREQRRLDNLKI